MKPIKFNNVVRIKGTGSNGQPREQVVKNSMTYAAADALISAIVQSGSARPTQLYAQYAPSGVTPALPSDVRMTTRDNFVQTGTNSGGLWVPLLAAPAVSATDATLYDGNQATFYFRIPGTPQSTQYTGNFQPGISYIYALGLAVATSANDRTGDIIISVLNSFTPFVIPSNGQESVDYPLQIIF
jgi:hypothetical protein